MNIGHTQALLRVVTIVLGVLAAVLALSLAWVLLFQGNQWAPLGPYPQQKILNGQPLSVDYDGQTIVVPSLTLEEVPQVQGTKCSSEEVTVSGRVRWASENPRGWNADGGEGVGVRAQGCTTVVYENHLPTDVVGWAQRELEDHPYVVVRIGGCETPYEPNGRSGSELCWNTEPFALVDP